MTNLHIDVTETAVATRRRRRLTRAFAVGALAAGAAVGMAVPAQAAGVTSVRVSSDYGDGARVVSEQGRTTGVLPDGTKVTIDCGIRSRNTVLHHITSPVTGYVTGYDLDLPDADRFFAGEAICGRPAAPGAPSATPTPTRPANNTTTAPAAAKGATMSYNEGVDGSCVYYALDRFHKLTGVYPKAVGDAKYLASGAAASGWTVSTTPKVDSMVIFQPGQNGASAPYGHAGWVEQVSGDRIYISEMNAPKAGVVTQRWLTPVSGVQYVYAN